MNFFSDEEQQKRREELERLSKKVYQPNLSRSNFEKDLSLILSKHKTTLPKELVPRGYTQETLAYSLGNQHPIIVESFYSLFASALNEEAKGDEQRGYFQLPQSLKDAKYSFQRSSSLIEHLERIIPMKTIPSEPLFHTERLMKDFSKAVLKLRYDATIDFIAKTNYSFNKENPYFKTSFTNAITQDEIRIYLQKAETEVQQGLDHLINAWNTSKRYMKRELEAEPEINYKQKFYW